MTLTRRTALALIAASAAAASAHAAPANRPPLDGTWGGAQGELTAQLIIAGPDVIGFYWRGDYLDTDAAAFTDDGTKLTFRFIGGKATLTRTDDHTATLDVTEGAKTTRLELKRD